MSCMEHICIQQKCGWYAMDNKSHSCCPRCRGPIRSYFDEAADHYEDLYHRDEGDKTCENLDF